MSSSRSVLVFVTSVLLACASIGSQPPRLQAATLTGQVVEMGGRRLMAAELDLLQAADTTTYYPPGKARDSSFVALTDSAGVYVFSKVPPGPYRLVVRMIGYHAIHERLQLESGERVRLDFRMRPTPPMQ